MYNSILVVLEREDVASQAAKAAVELAKSTGAKLHFVAFSYDFIVGNGMVVSEEESNQYKNDLLANRQVYLDEQIKHYQADGIEITGEVVWEEKIAN